MNGTRATVAIGALALLLLSFATGQRQREPLTNPEIDQLRDTAMEPDLRLKLYITFARDRLAKLDQVRSDPRRQIVVWKLTTVCRTFSMSTTS